MSIKPTLSLRSLPGVSGLVVLLIVLAGCATNPVTGKKELSFMSEAEEIRIGQEMDVEVRREMGVYDDPGLQEYVESIGLRLARSSERPHLPWQFAIVDVPAVNAFALPGGYIYLTRGIMSYLDDEAELAGVLGHEIGHVTARHAAQQYTRAATASIGLTIGSIFFPGMRPFGSLAETGLGILFLKYGRGDELQADRLGARYAVTNAWDPAGVPALLTTLQRIEEMSDRRGIPNWASTHPHPEDRVERVQPVVAELMREAPATLRLDREAYLRRIDGLVHGDDPREGVVRGNNFLHPDLRFALTFPDGWEVTNGKEAVVAKDPGREVMMVLQFVRQTRGRTLEEAATRGMRDDGYRQIEGARTTINGLDAYLGTYQGNAPKLGRVTTRAAHIQAGRTVYLLAGLARPDDYPVVERDFAAAIRSFRPLDRAEAADIRPNRIDLYVVRPGDTWQSIAQRAGQGNLKATTLAIMNNSAINAQPEPGRQIKIVVAG
jgi:predicted Zn-dependent protease